MTESTTTD